MTTTNTNAIERYRNNFLKEVEANVEEGHMVKMCMQCGVCAGSCPLGPAWQHSPQKIFMMIRAGKRDEVLGSDSMFMCTSCYNCMVRCPRQLPITHIMHGLANYAHRLGLAPKGQPTRQHYFRGGLVSGIREAMAMQSIGLGMFKAKRINPMEIFGGHGVKDLKGFHAIIAKAKEIEDRKKGFTA